ncbi:MULTISPECIES: hypothetical protein [unclassified Mesorhizobium]|uniref:hypothetical protein n=1 Tax=unclassified Mesorhizobium TaxID=325217 RepID=UPI0012DF8A07|nr:MULTISPECIES: hypothetical protein [unclassified Mesorhizobium]
MEHNPRYDGKPLLKLLEFYVLWVIGELPEEVDESLKAIAPKLHTLYGGDGQWQGAIAAPFIFPRKYRRKSGVYGRGTSKSLATTT